MKKCELCESVAKMYCESDQASLCWECDIKVHSANFLVAKHTRTLLCHVCQSLTPWNGSGLKLGPTVSVCENCINSSHQEPRNEGNDDEKEEDDGDGDDDDDGQNNTEDEDDDDDGGDDDGDDGDEDDEENQVVPWSSSTPAPQASSSSSLSNSEEDCLSESLSKSTTAFSCKRLRRNAQFDFQDDEALCLPSQQGHKDRKRTQMTRLGNAGVQPM